MDTTGVPLVLIISWVLVRAHAPRKLHKVRVMLFTVPGRKYPGGMVVGGLTDRWVLK
jgi:hypothetical protein